MRRAVKHFMDIAHLMQDWFKKQKKEDFYQKAAAMGIPISPFNNTKEVLESRQLKARNFFSEVEHPEAGKYGCRYIADLKASKTIK